MPTTTIGRNATGLRGVSTLMVRIGRGLAARSVSVPLPPDAQITWTAPGGDDTFTGTIPWPDRGIARPDAFTHNMPLRVEDRRTGEIIWQGRVSDPGFSGDRSGQEFKVSAVGSGHDLDMIAVLKNYMDRDPSSWTDQHLWPAGDLNAQEVNGFVAHFNDALQVPPDGMLEFPAPQGSTLNTGAVQRMVYLRGWNAGQDMSATGSDSRSTGPTAVVPEIHGLRFSVTEGAATANSVIEALAASAANGTTFTLYSASMAGTSQTDVSLREGVTGLWSRTDVKTLWLQQRRVGATVTQSSDGYVRFANFQVIGKRYNRYGTDSTLAYGVEALKPWQIFEDMLGTILNGRLDPGLIYQDSTLIDQASWWTATPVSAILDAASAWSDDTWWGVWAPLNPDTRPRLDYRSWNVTPRYTLDDTAHVELAGGGEEWANSALITYQRMNGVETTTRATVTVPAITRVFGSGGVGTLAYNTRDIAIDLTGEGPMSRALAVTRAGAAIKATASEKAAGSTVVRGPLLDDATGRIVQPWEIRPGWPVLVGATPNQFTSGTAVNFDGESTFRLSKVTYSASSNEATLELDGGGRKLFKGPATSKQKYRFVPQSARAHHHRLLY